LRIKEVKRHEDLQQGRSGAAGIDKGNRPYHTPEFGEKEPIIMSSLTINGSSTSLFATIRNDFKNLGSALTTGSLSDAQSAYSTLQADLSTSTSTSTSTATSSSASTGSTTGSNPLASDLASLGSALDSGSLTDAQQQFAEIQKHMQGRGEFARQQLEMQSTDATSSATQSTSSSDQSDPLAEDFQSLGSALTSGNIADAEQSLTTLQNDLSAQGLSSSSDNPLSKDLTSLSDALSSGDLSSAQQEFASIQQKMSHHPQGPPPGAGSGTDQSSGDTLQTDLQNLASSLQSGNISDAQNAFATLEKDLTGNTTTASSTTTASATTSTAASATSSTTDASSNNSSSGTALADYLKQAVASYLQSSTTAYNQNSSLLLNTTSYL